MMPSQRKFFAPKTLTLLFFTLLTLAAASVHAKERVVHVVYNIPEVTDEMVKQNPGTTKDTLIVKKSREVSKELAARLEKRLKGAKIKDYQVIPENFEVKVIIGGKDSEQPRFLELLKGPGVVELRPILQTNRPNWIAMSAALPDDVNVTGTESNQYLWTTNRDALLEALTAASMLSPETLPINGQLPEKRLIAAPDSSAKTTGGWRSYVLGKMIASNDSIEKTSWKMDAVGGYSTVVTLRKPVSVPSNISSSIALLVDDELIAILPSDKVKSHFTLTPPTDLPQAQQRIWARSMAGRLSADIKIPYAIAQYKEEEKK